MIEGNSRSARMGRILDHLERSLTDSETRIRLRFLQRLDGITLSVQSLLEVVEEPAMKAILTDPKFSIDQKVVFVNDYGVNFGEKTVTEYEWNDVRGHTYQYTDSGTPWFKTSERNLFAVEDKEGIAEKTVVYYHKQ